MLTPNSAPTPTAAARLASIYARLGEPDRHALLAFAEFLATRGLPTIAAAASPDLTEPPIPPPIRPARPEQETVIAAIRRLTLTYPMLDRAPILHATAALMSAHLIQGRAATQVIDELEALFLHHDARQRASLADASGNADGAPPGTAGQTP